VSGRQVVKHNEFVPSCSESLDAMAADVTSTPGNQDGSHLTVHTDPSGRSIISDQSKPTLTMRASCSALTKWLLCRCGPRAVAFPGFKTLTSSSKPHRNATGCSETVAHRRLLTQSCCSGMHRPIDPDSLHLDESNQIVLFLHIIYTMASGRVNNARKARTATKKNKPAISTRFNRMHQARFYGAAAVS
jgi:hypothetical protein